MRVDGVQLGLRCVDCDTLWPGDQLPKPAHTVEGYGPLAAQPSWRSRVEAMVNTPVEAA